MPLVRDVIGLRKTLGDIGVEIEVEGRNLPGETWNWRRDADPSLRGYETAEYVLQKPVLQKDLNDVFEELKEAFKASRGTIDKGYRAGVHVHINVQELTTVELFNFITLFLMFEDSIVDFCAPFRRGNHFCLRSKDAGYLLELLWRACTEGEIRLLNTEDIRYSAMNLHSVFKYGSVEFRTLESTDDFGLIKTWCDLLYTLKESAKKFTDPRDIMMQVSGAQKKDFVKRIFEEHSYHIEKSKDWEEKMQQGIYNAQDLAFSRTWGKSSLNIFDKKAGVF